MTLSFRPELYFAMGVVDLELDPEQVWRLSPREFWNAYNRKLGHRDWEPIKQTEVDELKKSYERALEKKHGRG